jgi:biopolymer transport protein ExbD
MAEKRRFLDVWIIESNTVYREVPFDVVADWIQQGRLLEDDKVRPSGTAEWFKIGAVPGFAAYLPKPEPTAEVNPVEALEPVEGGFTWKRRRDEDETDVDMIPLIDVSLVLLIYFVMRLITIEAGQPIPLPAADHGGDYNVTKQSIWVGVTQENKDGALTPVYSFGFATDPAEPGDRGLPDADTLVKRLEERLGGQKIQDLTVNADPDVESGVVDRLLIALEGSKNFEKKTSQMYTGVTKRQP